MITPESIDELIAQLDIVKVVGKDVELKKKGANLSGKCPFHDEKSASLMVSEAKQIFKCFGCGEGGDAVKFVMKKEGIEFIPAIKLLASRFNIQLEETEETAEEKEIRAKKSDLWTINAAAAKHYREKLLLSKDDLIPENLNESSWAAKHLIEDRKYTLDTILNFGLGFAPKEWDFILKKVKDIGLYYPAEEVGLVKSNDEAKIYDVFRNRLMFPIHNEHGQIVGFGGRKDPADKDDDNPKYINSKESILFKKDRVLYGLYQARKHIKDMGFAMIVEGYTDVISMHQAGAPNTVGSCGTAFTPGHAKLLKRYTSNAVLMNDGDAAGQKANFKAVNILLAEGFKVDICPLAKEDDPDTFARKHFVKSE